MTLINEFSMMSLPIYIYEKGVLVLPLMPMIILILCNRCRWRAHFVTPPLSPLPLCAGGHGGAGDVIIVRMATVGGEQWSLT